VRNARRRSSGSAAKGEVCEACASIARSRASYSSVVSIEYVTLVRRAELGLTQMDQVGLQLGHVRDPAVHQAPDQAGEEDRKS
jgi:hypothetical protein